MSHAVQAVSGMIESGSLTPGVRVERFGLPDHTAARFEMPAPALRGLVGSYHVFDSEKEWRDGVKPWLLPSWPAIRFILAPDTIALTIGSRRYDPMPVAALYGNASRAMQMTTHGGVTIGVDLTPLGWSRLFDARADDHRDRVVPLDTLLPAGWVACALDRLRASDRSTQVKAILDDLLLAIVRPPGRDDDQIVALHRLIADEDTRDLTSAAASLGMSPAALRRLSTRYFGFPPKTLLIRTRFVRSLVRMMLAGGGANYAAMAPTYFDASHFLRDADRFLGMTPRRFLQQDHRYLIACLNGLAEVRRADTVQRGAGAARPRLVAAESRSVEKLASS
ncbi:MULTISPECIES: AraC family transcriptional regulator [Sphingomonas]|uniref:AraC family transcriptional regulator n=1 Tax=Sphingomonas adhaesiva TaxID=28212 RepID=A0A2A4ICK7_9SPHN|nr:MULTISPECIES: helix-turn-helix domain-containing protein [Sphingomonas]PCG15522.1 AraC family transcriptional regulator [Sphingomonas adhaesiva]PZU80214.1 MAG: AraC family transcriptional regulator [Sphingomonas sp.]